MKDLREKEMIQIKRNDFDKLAQAFCDRLIIKQKRKQTLIERLRNSPQRNQPIYGTIIRDLQNIITANPDDLELIKNKYEGIFNKMRKNKIKDIKKEILNIFNYSNYEWWGAYQLALDLNVKTCPYCNRQYTFTVEKIKGKGTPSGTRPEFDHFYDKDTYPYLSLSFYNLIPSCHICNSNLKGKKQFSINTNVHPYREGFGDTVKFSMKILNTNHLSKANQKNQPPLPELKELVKDKKNFKVDFFAGNLDSFEIVFKPDRPTPMNNPTHLIYRAYNNIETFRLKDLYNMHKDIASELIQKAVMYNNTYINNL
ncbi:MAG TPA: hypothetical protein PKK05_27645, partial [Leptospiraceae bacterium]|nr:hypothetical protein [Leptospiraceae bacterium]